MDTEQQIRLNFLDEAEEYFDLMESNLLRLTNSPLDSSQIDSVLRSAHSIKGGAAMMSFTGLSQAAHRLEDFFKILRVRYVGAIIEVEVETSLLQSVDYLRSLANCKRQELGTADTVSSLEQSEISDRLEQIWSRLQSHLGDLAAEDENALLSQDEEFDPAILIFEEGVDGILDRFEAQLSALSSSELLPELTNTAEELIGFGNMANLNAFIQLCESVQQHAARISPPEATEVGQQALKTWRRCHALVLRGSVDKLPSQLKLNLATVAQDSHPPELPLDNSELFTDGEMELEFDTGTFDALELSGLQSAFDLDEAEAEDIFSDSDIELEPELDELQDAEDFAAFDPDELELDTFELDKIELAGLQSAFGAGDESSDIVNTTETPESPSLISLPQALPKPQTSQIEETVRVPVSQLKQFNTLFEQLVLNRNSVGLRLEQVQSMVDAIAQRMLQMEHSNEQLRQWYDRVSVEGLLSTKESQTSAILNPINQRQDSFDSLEMDRYSDIHLICQEQIETIVQLQEVSADITLGIKEVNQSFRELYYTTKSMQGNVTRTQMQPFSEVVKRFPRVIRDLNLQLGKEVNLKILGETTLLDRLAIEALSDPLMHLLRNSFDHGIEDSATRLAAGKPATGTISIQANNLGTYSIITLKDDGGGIPLNKIRDRLVRMGLESAEIAHISTPELLDFIFEPGFSTADKVTELSGRGVGMDVVRTNLKAIRGDIKVNTEPGQGTTFTLRIPFALSILRVAIVEQGKLVFAIPANSIRELIPVEPESMLGGENKRSIVWNKTEIPLIEIDKVLPYSSSRHSVNFGDSPKINRPMTLIVGHDDSFAALKLSRFWDEQESTIRAIDTPIPLPMGVISSVVFGDGKVIPLIDPFALAEANIDDRLEVERSVSNLTETEELPAVKTILVVDDSINVRRYLSLTLEKAGYRVEQAKDGRNAVDKLLGGLRPQGVICDVEMPRLDGYGVLEEIKQRSEFEHLPIAMLTSRSNDKHRKLAFNLGASAYFSKPYNEQELLDKLAEII
ncbi:MAG: hybrid sensor histidine kinase/response regulator [Cyanobacteria bacterium J06623_7]